MHGSRARISYSRSKRYQSGLACFSTCTVRRRNVRGGIGVAARSLGVILRNEIVSSMHLPDQDVERHSPIDPSRMVLSCGARFPVLGRLQLLALRAQTRPSASARSKRSLCREGREPVSSLHILGSGVCRTREMHVWVSPSSCGHPAKHVGVAASCREDQPLEPSQRTGRRSLYRGHVPWRLLRAW